MTHYGKIIGALVGWMLLRHPIGAVLGGLIGYAYDAGWFSSAAAPGKPPAEPPYKVLGVDPEATDAEVDQAYRRLMSQYHPDKVANAAEEIRELAERRAQSINTAYEAIQRERRAERP